MVGPRHAVQSSFSELSERVGVGCPVAGRISMILQVDALGCVPDGRFLDRVSMSASSAVLTDAGGGLRATDVGKHVAVPGAMDLVTSITELVNQKDVEPQRAAQAVAPLDRFRRMGLRLIARGYSDRTSVAKCV